MSKIKDEDGVPLKVGDYITFSFGIPPTCVTCQITDGKDGWTVQCLHPQDVKPKALPFAELTQYYQVWKASKQRVAAVLRNFREATP